MRYRHKQLAALAPDELLKKHRAVILRGPIDDDAAVQLVARLLFLQWEDPKTPIRFYIDSPGGTVTAGMSISDTMDELRPPVRTHCLTEAYGLAAVLLAHGAKGHRSAFRDAEISLCLVTPAEHAVKQDSNLVKTQAKLNRMLASDTGQTAETIDEDCRAARTFDTLGAVSYGLIDYVED
jgi:ATP-dependent Clp protease protease subunit